MSTEWRIVIVGVLALLGVDAFHTPRVAHTQHGSSTGRRRIPSMMSATLEPATAKKASGSSSSSSGSSSSSSLSGSLLDPAMQAAVAAVESASGINDISAAFTAAAKISPYMPADRSWSGVEKVVGLDKGLAEYDRDVMLGFFQQRPWIMASRALTVLQAYQRVKKAWDAAPDEEKNQKVKVDVVKQEELERMEAEKEAEERAIAAAIAEGRPVPKRKQTVGELLREEISALGPVAVKLGQTLSQRPDILPENICEALKALQTTNTPFPNEEAYQVISDQLGNKGPLDATGRLPLPAGCSADNPPLFRKLSADCIASASLGQVYKAETMDGREVAVKVQRPTALRQCLLDASIITVGLKIIEQTNFWNGDLLEVYDGVAKGVVQELDFRWEARNARTFADSLAFLGYVTVPQALPEFTVGPNVLVNEWIHGRHLSDLDRKEGLRMTSMAVEAVTAGLVLTGQVHADPHEGNVMLADDGRLVFLDFGLMSEVKPEIMEAFASGIQCVLSKDYVGLVKAFQDTGFVATPIEHREVPEDPWTPGDASRLARELRDAMEAAEGGGSRFGALSTVLFELGNYWCMYTPPYVILLIRTFLTLEGIAERVDPNFNIYEMALPWAIQRALSPETADAKDTLRSLLLNEDNEFQWARIDDAIEQVESDKREAAQLAEAAAAAAAAATTAGAAGAAALATAADGGEEKEGAGAGEGPAAAAAGASEFESISGTRDNSAATPLDSLTTVLGGGVEGETLRKILRDVDSTSLALKLSSKAARPARRMATSVLAEALTETVRAKKTALNPFSATRREAHRAKKAVMAEKVAVVELEEEEEEEEWPSSERADAIMSLQEKRAKEVQKELVKVHLKKQLAAGWRGAFAFAAVAAVATRVLLGAVLSASVRSQSLQASFAPLAAAAATLTKFATRAQARGVFVATGSAMLASALNAARLASKGATTARIVVPMLKGAVVGSAVALGALWFRCSGTGGS